MQASSFHPRLDIPLNTPQFLYSSFSLKLNTGWNAGTHFDTCRCTHTHTRTKRVCLLLFKEVVRVYHISRLEPACLGKREEGSQPRPSSRTKPSAKKQISKETQGRVYDYLFNLLFSEREGEPVFPFFLQAQCHLLVHIRPQSETRVLWRDTLKGMRETGDVLARGEG